MKATCISTLLPTSFEVESSKVRKWESVKRELMQVQWPTHGPWTTHRCCMVRKLRPPFTPPVRNLYKAKCVRVWIWHPSPCPMGSTTCIQLSFQRKLIYKRTAPSLQEGCKHAAVTQSERQRKATLRQAPACSEKAMAINTNSPAKWARVTGTNLDA